MAALSGAVAYIIMNTAIRHDQCGRRRRKLARHSTTTMLGITTLQMGVFGGIVAGLGVAALHNKFYKTELPQVLASWRYTLCAHRQFYCIWCLASPQPYICRWCKGIAEGALVLAPAVAGTFISRPAERAPIPFDCIMFYMLSLADRL